MPQLEIPPYYRVMTTALAVISIFLLFIIVLTLAYNRRRQRLLHRNRQLAEELARAEIEVREQALNDVAMELHDNLGQLLTLANLNLNYFKAHTDTETERLNQTKAIISTSIQEMRSLSRRLQGENMLREGLAAALQQQVDWANRSGQCRVSLEATGDTDGFFNGPGGKSLIVFRMIQELLNNALKHAQATHIYIMVQQQPGGLQITVTDNGVGLPENVNNSTTSLGMSSLHKRAQLLGARLNFESAPGVGTKVAINF
jgi:signal transduction histidine kinase